MTLGLLALTQRLSPAFPVGSFAYSHGLEWAISSGEVTDPASLALWTADVLAEGTGRMDAVLLIHAMRDDADLSVLTGLAHALAASGERLRETVDQGRAYLAALPPSDLSPDLPYPIAVGATSRGLGIEPVTVAALYLQAFTGMLVQAAVRFVPIGQGAGQAVIADLHPLIHRVAAEAAETALDALGSGAFRSDLAAMRHETMEVRIFRT